MTGVAASPAAEGLKLAAILGVVPLVMSALSRVSRAARRRRSLQEGEEKFRVP